LAVTGQAQVYYYFLKFYNTSFDLKKSWKIKKIDLNTLINVKGNSRAGMNDKDWLLTKYFF
jgi:hypothetical protein